MTNREFFIKRWAEEYPTFLKVFRALPTDNPEFRPHPVSRTAAALVWLLVLEEQACVAWASGKDVQWKETPPPKSLEKIIAAYQKAHADFEPGLKALDDETWENKNVRLNVGVAPGFYELPLGEMLWAVMFDAIHHRGQLSLYIRLTGGKVPPIYGSSADEKLE
ncbi:MAG: DinB family protein [Acidobacteria bacterium]|nr:DinB family protein [Acidobacteriota bacterium]MBI3663147.1 DinB family protein [Acidobacteriota bacterium]